MDYNNQISAHNADKILNGINAFLAEFNKGKDRSENLPLTLDAFIDQYNKSNLETKQKISKAIWLMGKAAVITNSPYYAKVSDIVFSNQIYEKQFLNHMNNCCKEAFIADYQKSSNYSKLENLIKDTILLLDKLSITSIKRKNLFDRFKENIINVNINNKQLSNAFETGLKQYKIETLKEITLKFSVENDSGLTM